MWTTSISDIMTTTVANLRTHLGAKVDHVVRIETAVEDVLAGELDGLMSDDAGSHVVALVMKGAFSERDFGLARSDVGDFAVTVFLCARREGFEDIEGGFRDRQAGIAGRLDDLEQDVDTAFDVVDSSAPFNAASYKVAYITRAGGPDQSASFVAGMAIVRPVEFIFTVKRS